ncbi:hypothetical protein PRIPAC_92067 [Pristionchus pacificus]|uniref:Uncharacterized protein n=1 Tax=Pristionchus pacificus TaxID=54126 RepID=A0A2A6BQU2_PRIPA|nr:hypothetical protein PRIPAC_92067 [Pristionchus pacificus]|eukprot:PDM68247.1 hypothetical protein PRIPAC_46291 [Pristionchus pacificus]
MKSLCFLLILSLLATVVFSTECPDTYKKVCSSSRPGECNPKCFKIPKNAADALLPPLDLCIAPKDWLCDPTFKKCVCQ